MPGRKNSIAAIDLIEVSVSDTSSDERDRITHNSAKGKIDIEAPSPRDVIGEGASKERANDASEGEDPPKRAEQKRALFEAGDLGEDCQDGDENS